MVHSLTLGLYVSLLGKLENLNLDETISTYGDKNQNKGIQSITKGRITQPSFGNPNGVQLYTVTYCDGSSYDYSGSWIQTEIEFELAEKYKL